MTKMLAAAFLAVSLLASMTACAASTVKELPPIDSVDPGAMFDLCTVQGSGPGAVQKCTTYQKRCFEAPGRSGCLWATLGQPVLGGTITPTGAGGGTITPTPTAQPQYWVVQQPIALPPGPSLGYVVGPPVYYAPTTSFFFTGCFGCGGGHHRHR